ncbi:MAG: Arm DNA-binding domain-containing protein, partial [Planctomycetota bacterium]|nr:Arm DNA-binding domain-containing protein [Planctomycetota bacterium]
MALTGRMIATLKPMEKAKKHFDGGGLFLFVTPTGGKLWRMAYRFHGKSKLLSFGQYPTVTLRMARDRREEAKRLLADDIDPSTRKRELK